MTNSSFRARANLFLIAFAGILLVSFGSGAYLLLRSEKTRTVQPTASTERVEDLIARAGESLKKQQTEQALVLYRRALSLNPRSVEAQLGVARGELAAGREDVAAREYERALELEKTNTTAVLQLARIYSHRSQTWGMAEPRYRDYLKAKPDDGAAEIELARVLSWRGKSKQAADIFSKPALSQLMTDQDREDYAFDLVKSGQTQQAEAVLKQMLANGQQHPKLRLQLASLYAARQEWQSALPIYRSLLQQNPNDPHINLMYGEGLLSAKDYRAATEPLAKACAAMPSNREAGLSYARALKGAGDYKNAARQFERILPLYAGNGVITREYADLLLEKRDYRKSAKYYKEAYGLGVHDVRLLVGLSGALRADGRPREALPYLEQAYKAQPTDRVAFELATVLHQAGKDSEAKKLLSTIQPTPGRFAK